MTNRWVFRLYNGLMLLALPFVLLWVVLRWRRRVFSKGLDRWSERWGHLDLGQAAAFQQGTWWWVHAVSLGEVKAIGTFLRRAPSHAGVHIVLSAVTPEALAWAAENRIAEIVIAAPIDLPWVVRRTMRAIRPKIFISVESEFWPNLLREAKRSGARVALINGRLSEHSFRSYRRIRPILGALWDCLDLIVVRQDQDAGRFAALGVPSNRLHVAGNLKYDSPISGESANGHVSLKGSGPLMVMGSTREGEEQQLLPVIQNLCRRWPELRVVWAPRHIDRMREIETLLSATGIVYQRKSALALENGSNGSTAAHVLWDSMGDLLDAYRQADVAVVGGSFVPKGGQNPIEPAALRVPVIFGPSMDNFIGIAETLVQNGGARQVSLAELEPCLQDLLEHPEKRRDMGDRAQQTVENRRGATDRALELLETLK